MPGWPEKQHTCVCGYTANAWANMVTHRRTCDSWQEHREGIRGKPQPEAAGARECPYCGAARGGDSAMRIHLKSCDDAKDLSELSKSELADLAIDLWCLENDRD